MTNPNEVEAKAREWVTTFAHDNDDTIFPKQAYIAGYLAGYAAASTPIKCSDEMPKIGQSIVLYYPLTHKGWSWVAGEVDGSDDGIFVDYDLDGQEITTRCLWLPLPKVGE